MTTMSDGFTKFQRIWKKVPEKCHGVLLTVPVKTEGDCVSALAIAAITLRTLYFADILTLEEEKYIYEHLSTFYKKTLAEHEEKEEKSDDQNS